jgi:hypothetical protein
MTRGLTLGTKVVVMKAPWGELVGKTGKVTLYDAQLTYPYTVEFSRKKLGGCQFERTELRRINKRQS